MAVGKVTTRRSHLTLQIGTHSSRYRTAFMKAVTRLETSWIPMPGLSCSKRLVSALAILSSMAGRSSPGASSTLAGAVTFARWWSKGSTPALGLVPVPLQLDEFGQPHDQAGEFLRLVSGQPRVREGDGVRWLSVQVRQRQTIGIDYAIAPRDRIKSPWSGKAALRYGCEDKLRRRWQFAATWHHRPACHMLSLQMANMPLKPAGSRLSAGDPLPAQALRREGAWPPDRAPFSCAPPLDGHVPAIVWPCSRPFCAACLDRQSGATPPVERGAAGKWTRAPLSVSVVGGAAVCRGGKPPRFQNSLASRRIDPGRELLGDVAIATGGGIG